MRVLVMVPASKESEAGQMPSERLLAEMTAFNEQLVNAGIWLAGEGLHPSSKGRRVTFSPKPSKVVDGPFTESKELIAGFWIWKVKDMDEAVSWIKRMPNPDSETFTVELRQFAEMEDFGDNATPELLKMEERRQAATEKLAKKK